MNILILQLKRIGDTILTAPALSQIRATFPDAKITLVLPGPSGHLAAAIPQVDEVLVYQPKTLNGKLWCKLAFTHWHLAADFTGTDRSLMMTLIARASLSFTYKRYRKSLLARMIYNAPVIASARDLSTVNFHLAMSERLSSRPAPLPVGPYLRFLADDSSSPDQLPERYAVLHPGTARDEKYWTTDGWLDVANHLHHSHHLAIVLTGSSDQREQDHLNPIRDGLDQRGIPFTDLSGKISLTDSARAINGAEIVITVDSAAMHLAAQFCRPQVGLFGPTNPYHWAPTHADARVILASAPDKITSSFIPKHHKAPMTAIPSKTVIAAIDELLAPQAALP